MQVAVSPVSGIVDGVDGASSTVRFVIRTTDDHEVRAPVPGVVKRVDGEGGVFRGELWTVPSPKTERIIFEIGDVEFALEVGKPKYVTDTIRVDAKVGDRVERGQVVAEILIGSRAEMSVDGAFGWHDVVVERGDAVVAGVTPVFRQVQTPAELL